MSSPISAFRVASDAAIARLPANVTLAFDSQSPVVGAWCARARQAGHETLLMLPMEPFDYPRSDPGPNTLLSNLPTADNIQRLLNARSQANGYVGVTTLSGTRFTTEPDKITPVLDVLHRRGLMVFDARIAPHSAIADIARDHQVPVGGRYAAAFDQNLTPTSMRRNPEPDRADGAPFGPRGRHRAALARDHRSPWSLDQRFAARRHCPRAAFVDGAMTAVDYRELPYRQGVGLCLFNREGLVLVAERRDRPGAWQMPQGGIQKRKRWHVAALRELKEEVGTDKAEIIGGIGEKLHYEFPDWASHKGDKPYRGKYRGQEQNLAGVEVSWFRRGYKPRRRA